MRHFKFNGIDRAGILLAHIHELGDICDNIIPFDIPPCHCFEGDRWKVKDWNPLTLIGAIFRPECGLKGEIYRGLWVPVE